MENNENQIEEMAKLIADSCTIQKTYVNKHYPDRQKDKYYSLAEELLKRYQPKPQEDSVVLSKEECDAHKQWLKELAKSNKEFEKIGYAKGCKASAEKVWNNGVDYGKKIASKETADKILKFVLNMAYFDLDGQLIFPVSSLRNYITNKLNFEIKE